MFRKDWTAVSIWDGKGQMAQPLCFWIESEAAWMEKSSICVGIYPEIELISIRRQVSAMIERPSTWCRMLNGHTRSR